MEEEGEGEGEGKGVGGRGVGEGWLQKTVSFNLLKGLRS
jgi:hypothetical protein